jgi:phosphatidylserine decarboxylase
VGRVLGRFAEHRWHPRVGRAIVRIYSRVYGVSFDECEQKHDFASFDAFFTRRLRPAARPVDPHPLAITSPADGIIDSMGPVDAPRTFKIKGHTYRVEDLVGDPDDARRYIGGAGCVIYLSPGDYHRVHAPVDGIISRVRSLPGDHFPVNAVGVRHIRSVFARNRRVAIALDTPALGRVTVVMVAAMVVGRVTVRGVPARDVPLGDHMPDESVRRGDEIGVFHLGSTAVVFFERSALDRWSIDAGRVRFGQRIALTPSTRVAAVAGMNGGAR